MQVLRLKKAIRVLAMLVAGWSALPYCRIAAPAGFALLFPKLLAGALTPVLGAISALGALAGLAGRDPLAFLSGGLGAPVVRLRAACHRVPQRICRGVRTRLAAGHPGARAAVHAPAALDLAPAPTPCGTPDVRRSLLDHPRRRPDPAL